MKKKIIIANWKCNPTTLKKAKNLFLSIKKEAKNISKVEIIICAPFVFLGLLDKKEKKIKLGAQNCFFEKEGAFTGEISPLMLKDIGVNFVILGHSERRRYFKETDEEINKKINLCLKEKLSPILCIGETEKERKQDKTFKVLKKQIKIGLKGVSALKLQKSDFFVAYEPVWAIGTGNFCNSQEAGKTAEFIRKFISSLYDEKTAKKIKILYGGSVNAKNAKDYLKDSRLDGLLIGGASLKAKEFKSIIKIAQKQVD